MILHFYFFKYINGGKKPEGRIKYEVRYKKTECNGNTLRCTTDPNL